MIKNDIFVNKILYNDMEELFNKNIDWKRFDNKTVLISGAYGMLASYITSLFVFLHNVKGINVKLILMVKSKDKLQSKLGITNNDFIRVQIESICSPIDIDGPVDYIIHAASLASPQYYSSVPVDVLEPNTIGTYYLLKLAVRKRVEGFLLFSSGDVYGRVMHTNIVGEDDFGSMDTLDIHNCYSESKRMAETMCKSFYIQYDVPVKFARIWHTYAPTMDFQNDSRVFSSFVKNVVEGKDIVLKSDGSGKRSFCYITDAVAGLMNILLIGKIAEAYNICNENQYYSMLELADIVSKLRPQKRLNVVCKCRDKNDVYVENVHLKGNDVCPTSAKLQMLGWSAEVDVKTGFDRVLRYIGVE